MFGLGKLYILFIFSLIGCSLSDRRISNERRCANADCSKPISHAKTLLTYNGDDSRLVSFGKNEMVTVISKEAGDIPTFWEIQVHGRRGYAPKDFLRETEVFVSNKEVNIKVSTGRDSITKNISDKIDKRKAVELNGILKTPELPVEHSKGFFSTIVGASADSVPPPGRGINPQTSSNYLVIEGTTIYGEPASESGAKTSSHEETSLKPIPQDVQKEKAEVEAPLTVENAQENDSQQTLNHNKIQEDVANSEEIKSLKAESDSEKPEIDVTKATSNLVGEIFNTVSNLISSSTEAAKTHLQEEEEEYDDEESNDDDDDDEDDIYKVSEEVIEEQSYATSVSAALKTSPESEVVNEVKTNLSTFNEKKEHDDLSNSQIQTENILKAPVTSNEDIVNNSSDEKKLSNEIKSDVAENKTNMIENSEQIPLGVSDKEDEDHINKTLEENVYRNAFNTTSDILNKPVSENISETNNQSIDDSIDSQPIHEKPHDTLNEGLDNDEEKSNDEKEIVKHSIDEARDKVNVPNLVLDQPNEEIVSTLTNSEYVQKEENPLLDHSHEGATPDQTVTGARSTEEITTNVPVITIDVTDIPFPVVKSVSESPEPKVGSQIKNTSPSPDIKKQTNDFMFGFSQEKSSHVDDSYKVEPEMTFSEDPTIEQKTDSKKPEGSIEVDLVSASSDLTNTLSDSRSKDKPIISLELVYNTAEESKESVNLQAPQDPLPMASDLSEPFEQEIDEKSSSTETSIGQEYDIGSAQDKFIEQVINTPPVVDHSPISDDSSHGEEDHSETSTLMEPNTVVPEESDQGIFSSIMQSLNFFPSPNQDANIVDVVIVADETNIPSTITPSTLDTDKSCQAEGLGEKSCDSYNEVSWQDTLSSADASASLGFIDLIPIETTIWLVITALAVVIFSLGHYYIEAHRRDGPLVGVINKLEKEVLILRKETCIMEDRLTTATHQLEAWTTNTSENDALIIELRQELDETKAAKSELEEQLGLLEREVESVTENGLEMHRLLEESLSSHDGSQVLLSTVETLRERLERQEEEIAGLSHRLSNKTLEVEELEKRLVDSGTVAVDLENKIINIAREKEEEALALKDHHRQLMAQLEEAVETKALEEMRMSTEITKLRLSIEELQKTLAEKDSDIDELKEVVKELRSTDSNDKMEALFDAVGIRAQLRLALTERDETRERLNEEEGARKLLEGHMKKVTQEVTELKNKFEAAEKEKIDALTKLQVLSNYFKEKELELQKELGLQESIWLQKQSDNHSIYEQMRSLREENEKYKLQNESLKKEIVEQEASFKIQIANVEQKAHENWVTSRQAERKLKEVQQEAAQLRNRLTSEKAAANYSSEDGKQNISESNGDPSSPPPSLMFPPSVSPPFMMYRPPGDFVPPPPLVSSPYHPDSRPPPLGRISSPPLDHSRTTNSPPHLNMWTPPPPMPYQTYDYPSYGHHSPSPPPPMPPVAHHRNVHKPQPREMSKEQKDHSPNYMPDTDKAVRRNKR